MAVKNRDAVQEALESIRQSHAGILRAEDVVDAAAAPESPLHQQFLWDDTEAARQFRLVQARNLITVFVQVLPGPSKEPVQCYVSLQSDRREAGGGYRLVHDVMADPEMRARFLDEALSEFNRAECKYGKLVELAPVFVAVRKVRVKRGASTGAHDRVAE